ncbi:MAG: hypothetical protein ACK5VE_06020 [Alphaproteobacteria bacterium]|jgi:uncharacterized protein YcfJ
MKNTLTTLMALALLAGCTTPKTVLKNPNTGQVAICGGSATGSLVGGVIGYHIQKGNDAECAGDYMAQGFKRIDNQQ